MNPGPVDLIATPLGATRMIDNLRDEALARRTAEMVAGVRRREESAGRLPDALAGFGVGDRRQLFYEEAVALSGPMVYAWIRGSAVLYIGSSSRGIGRCLDPGHHRIDLERGDLIELYPMESEERAREVERWLIAELRPLKNVAGIPGRRPAP